VTDVLARLVDRTLGREPSLQPLVASRFGPSALAGADPAVDADETFDAHEVAIAPGPERARRVAPPTLAATEEIPPKRLDLAPAGGIPAAEPPAGDRVEVGAFDPSQATDAGDARASRANVTDPPPSGVARRLDDPGQPPQLDPDPPHDAEAPRRPAVSHAPPPNASSDPAAEERARLHDPEPRARSTDRTSSTAALSRTRVVHDAGRVDVVAGELLPSVLLPEPRQASRGGGLDPSALAPWTRTSPDEHPVIHVHIGRVELRAPEPVLAAEPAAAPPLSLDEYLRRRRP